MMASRRNIKNLETLVFDASTRTRVKLSSIWSPGELSLRSDPRNKACALQKNLHSTKGLRDGDADQGVGAEFAATARFYRRENAIMHHPG